MNRSTKTLHAVSANAVAVATALLVVACGAPPKSTGPDAKKQVESSPIPAHGASMEELQERLKLALTEPDPAKRSEKLEALIDHFPKGSPGYEFTARSLIQSYSIAGNLDGMERAASRVAIEDDLTGAELLNAMAYAYAEAGKKLPDARTQVIRALNILDMHERRAPPWRGADPNDWIARIEKSRGYYLDTLAWIDVKTGRLTEAIATLREAVNRANLAAIRFHLGHALEKNGQFKAAAEEYARASVLGGEDATKAKDALTALASNPAHKIDGEAILAAVKKSMLDTKRMEIVATAIDEEVPEFKIADLDGNDHNQTTLAQGNITIIDFWASWCGPCKEEFPILQEVYEHYKDNDRVKWLAITVDQDLDAAKDFIKQGKYTLPIAHEAGGTLAAKFGVHGLPTLLIIGPNGSVRFKHIGFNPELRSILPVQIEALLDGTLDAGPSKAEVKKP